MVVTLKVKQKSSHIRGLIARLALSFKGTFILFIDLFLSNEFNLALL